MTKITHTSQVSSVTPAPGTYFVRVLEQAGKSSGGIILPENQVEAPNQAVIVYAGESTYKEGLKFLPKVGDRISMKRFGFSEIIVNGEMLRQIGANDVLAILE